MGRNGPHFPVKFRAGQTMPVRNAIERLSIQVSKERSGLQKKTGSLSKLIIQSVGGGDRLDRACNVVV